MTSEAFVWIYLPGQTEPVVCARLIALEDGTYSFLYGRSYRDRADAIPLSPETLPLNARTVTGRRPGALPGPMTCCRSDVPASRGGKR